jgi:hypothetical protein
MGAVLCGGGLLALGSAFLAGDLWPLARGPQQHRLAAGVPRAQIWSRSSATSRRISVRPDGG